MMILFCVRTTHGNYGPFEFYSDAHEFAKRDPASLIETFTDDWSPEIERTETEQRQRRRSRQSSENTP